MNEKPDVKRPPKATEVVVIPERKIKCRVRVPFPKDEESFFRSMFEEAAKKWEKGFSQKQQGSYNRK